MKMWSKLAFMSAIFATCLPARGEILIYQMKMNYFSTLGQEEPWTSVSEDKVNAYVVLDVSYAPDGSINSINNAVKYEYDVWGRFKWYWTQVHYFQVANIETDRATEWVIVETEYLAGAEIWVMKGKAMDAKIGLSGNEKRVVARQFKGDILVVLTGVEGGYQTCSFSMRLNTQLTQRANDINEGNQDFDYAMDDIVEEYLEDKGYNPG